MVYISSFCVDALICNVQCIACLVPDIVEKRTSIAGQPGPGGIPDRSMMGYYYGFSNYLTDTCPEGQYCDLESTQYFRSSEDALEGKLLQIVLRFDRKQQDSTYCTLQVTVVRGPLEAVPRVRPWRTPRAAPTTPTTTPPRVSLTRPTCSSAQWTRISATLTCSAANPSVVQGEYICVVSVFVLVHVGAGACTFISVLCNKFETSV